MISIRAAVIAACALPVIGAAPAAATPPVIADAPVAVIGAPRGSEDLRVQVLGAARPVRGGRVAVRVVITNPSDVAMTDVRVRLRLPAGVRPVAPSAARRRGRIIVWNVRHIAPGRSRIRHASGTLAMAARSRRCSVVRVVGPTTATARRCFTPRRP